MIKLLKNNYKTIILLLLIILVLYLVYEKNDKEQFNNCRKAKFIFLYMDGCKYCDDLKKIWNPNGLPREFQKKIKKDSVLKDKVELLAFKNNTQEHDKRIELIKESGGYPTLVLEKCNGRRKIYNGARDTDSFLLWLRQNI